MHSAAFIRIILSILLFVSLGILFRLSSPVLNRLTSQYQETENSDASVDIIWNIQQSNQQNFQRLYDLNREYEHSRIDRSTSSFSASWPCLWGMEEITTSNEQSLVKWGCGIAYLKEHANPDCVVYSFGSQHEGGYIELEWETSKLPSECGVHVFQSDAADKDIFIDSDGGRVTIHRWNGVESLSNIMDRLDHCHLDILNVNIEEEQIPVFFTPNSRDQWPSIGQMNLRMKNPAPWSVINFLENQSLRIYNVGNNAEGMTFAFIQREWNPNHRQYIGVESLTASTASLEVETDASAQDFQSQRRQQSSGDRSGSSIHKLAVIQFDTRYKLEPRANDKSRTTARPKVHYSDQTAELNRLYAERWNYSFYRIQYTQNFHSEVAKVSLLKEVMDHRHDVFWDSDWILYLDSDAWISRFEWNIDDIVELFNLSLDIHISVRFGTTNLFCLYFERKQARVPRDQVEQEPAEHLSHQAKFCPQTKLTADLIINGGVILMRNSQIAQDMINTWYDAIPDYTPLVKSYPGDQGLFSCVLSRHPVYGPAVRFDKDQRFQNLCNTQFGGYHDAWIQHLAGPSKGTFKSMLDAEIQRTKVVGNGTSGLPYIMFQVVRRGEAPMNYELWENREESEGGSRSLLGTEWIIQQNNKQSFQRQYDFNKEYGALTDDGLANNLSASWPCLWGMEAITSSNEGSPAKWGCGITYLQEQRDGECIVYAFESQSEQRDIEFESKIVHLLPDCELHVFEFDAAAKDIVVEREKVTVHHWNDGESLSNIMDRLGHFHLDFLDVDMESEQIPVFFPPNSRHQWPSIGQMNLRTKNPSQSVIAFFEDRSLRLYHVGHYAEETAFAFIQKEWSPNHHQFIAAHDAAIPQFQSRHLLEKRTTETHPAKCPDIKINVDTLKFLQSLFDSHMNHLNLKRTISGNILQREKELFLWAQLAHMPQITAENPTICEIGFAYGFSAVAILSQHPTVQYVGFEFGHPSMDATWNIVHTNYPNRTQLMVGDSSTKIRELASSGSEIVCDAWIIDADHSYKGAKKDLDAILDTRAELSTPNSLILWDDCDPGDASGRVDAVIIEQQWPTEGIHQVPYSKGPTKVFTEAVVNGQVTYISHGTEIDSKGRFVGWCVSQIFN